MSLFGLECPVRIAALVALTALAVAAATQPEALTLPTPRTAGAPLREARDPAQPQRITPSSTPLDLSRYPPGDAPSNDNGAHAGLPQELYTAPGGAPGETPVVQRMSNMYQLDQTDSDLFGPTGRSMLCGAASMANALMFLRVNRNPPIDDIAKTSMSPDGSKDDLLRMVFDRCHVSRAKGSTDRQLLDCASDFLAEGGYAKQGAWLRSMWSKVGSSDRSAPQPSDISETVQLNRVAVLLFGWYTASKNPATDAWTYIRTGGHFVTLAGYDRADQARIYVSNPLIDYDALGVDPVSALVLEPVAPDITFARLSGDPSDDLNAVRGRKWQTRDLTAHRIAVLESLLVVGPLPQSNDHTAPR